MLATEGGAAAACHALTLSECCRSYEAVVDVNGLGVALPSYEAAATAASSVQLEQLAVEEASLEGNSKG